MALVFVKKGVNCLLSLREVFVRKVEPGNGGLNTGILSFNRGSLLHGLQCRLIGISASIIVG